MSFGALGGIMVVFSHHEPAPRRIRLPLNRHGYHRPEMAMRVVDPVPLRALGSGTLGVGAFILDSTGLAGTPALIGAVLVAIGLVVLDGVGRELVGLRQVWLFLIVLGGVLLSWALLVLVLVRMIGFVAAGPEVYVLLSAGGVGVAAGVVGGSWERRHRRHAEPVSLRFLRSADERRGDATVPAA